MLFAGFLRIIERRELDSIANVISDYKENFAEVIEEVDLAAYPEYMRLIEDLYNKDTYVEFVVARYAMRKRYIEVNVRHVLGRLQ